MVEKITEIAKLIPRVREQITEVVKMTHPGFLGHNAEQFADVPVPQISMEVKVTQLERLIEYGIAQRKKPLTFFSATDGGDPSTRNGKSLMLTCRK